MGRQGVITEKRTIRTTVRFGGQKEKQSGKADSAKKGLVAVKPHVRLINGRPVYVAGYTYKRS